MMWWKLCLLVAATAVVLFFLFAPMKTVSITVDLPPAPPGAKSVSPRQVQEVVHGGLWAIEAALGGLILGIAGWIGWWIVRGDRNPG
jgi:hypothetical protein